MKALVKGILLQILYVTDGAVHAKKSPGKKREKIPMKQPKLFWKQYNFVLNITEKNILKVK